MRALVTGADGFVGHHLVAHLRAAGDDVVEAAGPSAVREGDRYPVDVRDGPAVTELVTSAQPDVVYHLAAVSYGPDASADLHTALEVTVDGTIHVLQAALACDQQPLILIAGSSEVYGAPDVERVDESTPTRPVNLYGATKLAQEAVAIGFAHAHQLRVIATRSFNHIGPGQRDSFAVASFARQLAEIQAGHREPVLRVGNLWPVRDFTDVRDVVRAYRSLAMSGTSAMVVNVASGIGTSLGDLLAALIDAAGVAVRVEVDQRRVRQDDPQRIVGDPSLLKRITGWHPGIGLDRTLGDVWSDALERCA